MMKMLRMKIRRKIVILSWAFLNDELVNNSAVLFIDFKFKDD